MTENLDITQPQLSRIFLMMSINTFGLSLISVFIPIYLLKLGYSFQWVIFWIITNHFTLLVFSFLVVKISNTIGLVRCLHIRFVLLLTYLTLMFFLPTSPNLFYVIPIIIGAELAFFWMPLNILFVRNTQDKTMGRSLSKFFAYPKIFSIIAPVIGSVVISYFGFNILFGVAIVIVFLAFIPVLPLSSEKTNFVFNIDNASRIWKENKKFFIPEIIDNFVEDAGVVLSIFTFIKLINVVEIGFIGTLSSLTSIAFTLTIGKLTDEWDRHRLLKIGAIMVSAVWLLNFYIGQYNPSPWLFYISAIALAFSLKVFLVPYQSMLFNTARKDDAEFIVLREIPTVFGRLILYSMSILFFDRLPVIFLITALLILFFVFYNTKKFEPLATVA